MTTKISDKEKNEIKHKNYLSFILSKTKKVCDIDDLYDKLLSYKIDFNNRPAINKFILEDLIITPDLIKKKRAISTKVASEADNKDTPILPKYIEAKEFFNIDYTKYESLKTPTFLKSLENISSFLPIYLSKLDNGKILRSKISNPKKKNIASCINFLKHEILFSIIKVLHSGNWDVHEIVHVKDLYDNNTTMVLKIFFSSRFEVNIPYVDFSTKKYITKNLGKYFVGLLIYMTIDGKISLHEEIRPFQNNCFAIHPDHTIDSNLILSDDNLTKDYRFAANIHPYLPAISITKEKTTNNLLASPTSNLALCFGNTSNLIQTVKEIDTFMYIIHNVLNIYSESGGPYAFIRDFREDRIQATEEYNLFKKDLEESAKNSINPLLLTLIHIVEDMDMEKKYKNLISKKVSRVPSRLISASESTARYSSLLEVDGEEEYEEEEYEEEEDDEEYVEEQP